MIDRMNRLGSEGTPFLFMIDYECKRLFVQTLEELDNGIFFDIAGHTNWKGQRPANRSYRFERFPPSFEEYKAAFDKVQDHQKAGNSYLANLTFPSRIETDLSLLEIFLLGQAKYKLFFKDLFTVFSPESFVQIKDGRITTCPMKGTIDASLPDAENAVLTDEKEAAEHLTIVDLMRNDLSKVSKNVRVESFRWIDRIKTRDKDLLQVSSSISGDLGPGYENRLGDILFDLLPAGSISGAPKKRTLDIIREAENYERGYYTGIFGCFDGNTLDSSVMIRFIEKKDGALYYKSGGGITVYSDPVKEYRELVDKIYVPIV